MANCFATSVGSKALTVKQAVVIASVCEFFGALLMGSNVAKTIRKGIADVNCYKDNPGLLIYGMTCVIIAVAIWLVLASYLELPVSTTHSCVGGIIGMTLMTRSTRCVIWNKDPDNMAFENFPWTGGVAQIVISWVLSPVASGVCAAAIYAVVRYGIFAWENCYLRARVAFPLVVFFTVTVNVTYFIVKGAKGQAERFGTVGMVREAKEEGNLAPAIGMGAIFGAVAAAVAAGMLPMLSKKVEAEDFTDAVAGARADPADVEAIPLIARSAPRSPSASSRAARASTPGSSPSAASAGSSRSSSSARRPRSSSGPRPSRSRASTATTTARSTPASGCSERSSFPARAGHQGIDRTRPGHQDRPAARARATAYVHS